MITVNGITEREFESWGVFLYRVLRTLPATTLECLNCGHRYLDHDVKNWKQCPNCGRSII